MSGADNSRVGDPTYSARQLAIVIAMLLALAAVAAFSIWGPWPSSRTTAASPVTSAPATTSQQPRRERD